MEHFNNFIEEVETLEVKVKNGFYDLSQYDQKDSGYDSKIIRLQQLALSEILLLKPEQIRRQLKRIEQIQDRFERFWKKFSELYHNFDNGTLDSLYLELEILPLFITAKIGRASITLEFIFDLHDAIMYKDGCLGGFVSQVQKTQEPAKLDKSKPTFSDLFRLGDREKVPEFISILKRLGYLNSDGKRHLGFDAGAFVNLFHWLKDKPILIEGNKTTQAKIFLLEFGIVAKEKGGDITTRAIGKRMKGAPAKVDPDIVSLFKD
jgi:hypothetical protein